MKIAVLALTMVTAFTMSALAADWNFYGSARISTFVTDKDGAAETFNESLQGNSRIGANIKVSDELSGRFEYGASSGKANIRLLYGSWNFGAGELIVGQTYAPVWLSVSSQAYNGDNGLTGWGENYAGRAPQLQLKFGDLKIALLQTNTKISKAATLTANTEGQFPAIQAKYRIDFKNVDLTVSGAYQTFEVNDFDIDSYMLAARIGITFGQAAIKASVFNGTNVGNITTVDVNSGDDDKGYAMVKANGVTDVDALGYALAATYTLNEMVSFEAGLGYAEIEADTAASTKDDVVSYYVQAPLTLAPGVIIVPEVGVLDYKDNADETVYYGAKWQINF